MLIKVFMCLSVLSACPHMCHMCACCLWRPEEGTVSPRTGVLVVRHHVLPKLCPLKEKQVFLISKPSLQFCKLIFSLLSLNVPKFQEKYYSATMLPCDSLLSPFLLLICFLQVQLLTSPFFFPQLSVPRSPI